MSEKSFIARAAGIVGSATLLSRIFGLVRDQVVAYYFGAGMGADAFFVAFRIPNLLRRLLAEGALTVSFVPIFTEYLRTRSREEAFQLARIALTFFSLLLAGTAVAGVLASPWIVRAFAPGFFDDPDKFALTVLLTRIMFPYIFLVGLVALAMGILNSLDRFAAPALAPVMLNVGMIGAVLFLSRYFDPPILALAVGVIIGGTLQVLLQIPYMAREKGLLGLSFNFGHPALKRIGLLMVPAALGAAVYQFSVFVNTLLASFLPEGSVSYLYYADRIVQFPLGVFAIALGTAVLPAMSRQAADQDLDGLGETFSFSMRLVFFITIPAMVGMIILAEPLIRLLFQRGRFDPAAALATAQALIGYSAGLCALSAVQIVVRVFYSLKDTRTPALVAAASLLGGLVLALALMGPLGHVGLALASSGSSIINFSLLIVILRRRLGSVDGRRVLVSALKNTLWAGAMAGAVLVSARLLPLPAGSGLALQAARVLGLVGGGVLVYALLAWAFRAPEMSALLNLLKRKKKPPLPPT